MSHSNQDKKHGAAEKPMSIGDWVMDHSKIVLPLILVVCVLITVVLAINANKKEALEKESQQAAMAVASEQALPSVDELETPQFELEENAYPEINNLIRTYYDAQAEGDIETISSLNTYLDEIETIRVQELSKYIDSYPVLNVYTKPGLAENTYVTYVYSEVQFSDVDLPLPGMQTYYIGINDEGDYFINDGTYDDTVWNYIKEITLQDDVVDLNNKVVVEYNELLAEDEELNEFIAYLKEKINEDVGEILAQAESAEEETPAADTAQEEGDTQGAFQMIRTARATDVVNIRTSDSEEADKIDKAQVGQEFTLLEQKGNGWSRVEYNGKDAFIKSDYLEIISEETLIVDTSAPAEETQEEEEGEAVAASNDASMGTVKVIENVRVRKSASTEAESLGTVYVGDELELLMKQADGWTKIKYQGQTAYVKSEYVE
ncbi:MAG: SH3 domain-containing protein [Lachnospiraceae bacterium]|nr:SH3 domain-containing protein [Lachnospiraceae bacterium]